MIMLFLVCLFILLAYFIARITCGIAKSNTYLAGKVAIVTGGNAGIGYEVCLNLASRGCKVIIADKDDSSETRTKIIDITKNPNIVSKKLDLSSFKSVREFAEDINKTEERLDILVNNAGIGGPSDKLSEDGLNMVMQVNYFGPFLLTHLLANLLKRSSPSRIVFTSSHLSFLGELRACNFSSVKEDNKNMYDASSVYGTSKLATTIASDIFAKKLESCGVTSNSVHPGVIFTKIYTTSEQATTLNLSVIRFLSWLFGKSTWEGAQTTIHVATSEELEGVTGKYFADCRQFPKPPQTYNQDLCKKIWEISEEYVKLSPEERI